MFGLKTFASVASGEKILTERYVLEEVRAFLLSATTTPLFLSISHANFAMSGKRTVRCYEYTVLLRCIAFDVSILWVRQATWLEVQCVCVCACTRLCVYLSCVWQSVIICVQVLVFNAERVKSVKQFLCRQCVCVWLCVSCVCVFHPAVLKRDRPWICKSMRKIQEWERERERERESYMYESVLLASTSIKHAHTHYTHTLDTHKHTQHTFDTHMAHFTHKGRAI